MVTRCVFPNLLPITRALSPGLCAATWLSITLLTALGFKQLCNCSFNLASNHWNFLHKVKLFSIDMSLHLPTMGQYIIVLGKLQKLRALVLIKLQQWKLTLCSVSQQFFKAVPVAVLLMLLYYSSQLGSRSCYQLLSCLIWQRTTLLS